MKSKIHKTRTGNSSKDRKNKAYKLKYRYIFWKVTQIVAVSRVFVLLPAYFAILILVIVLPVFVYIVLDVPPLSVFDPIVQLCMANIAIFVSVNALHNLPMEKVARVKVMKTTSFLFLKTKPQNLTYKDPNRTDVHSKIQNNMKTC